MDLPVEVLTQNGIERGVILHSDIFKNIDHGKFFVVVGITKDYIAGYFFINSNIHKSIQSKPEQLAMQCILKRSDYGFLRYDSFLSAIMVNEIPCERLAKSMQNGVTKIVGQLKKEHLDDLLEKTRNSRLFSKKVKEMYFYE